MASLAMASPVQSRILLPDYG